MTTNREHFIYRAVADYFAHDALRQIAQRLFRLSRAKQIHLRIGDAVLHHPRNQSGVQISGDHRFGVFGLTILLVIVGGILAAEAELQFQQPLCRQDVNPVHIGNGISQTWTNDLVISAESRFYADRVSRNAFETEYQRQQTNDDTNTGDDAEAEAQRMNWV